VAVAAAAAAVVGVAEAVEAAAAVAVVEAASPGRVRPVAAGFHPRPGPPWEAAASGQAVEAERPSHNKAERGRVVNR